MYTLLNGLYRIATRKEEYNVLIIGLDNAGKTTLLEKIKGLYTSRPGLPADKILPTVGLNVAKIVISSSIVHFWDLGGQKDLRRLWKQYYPQCHGIFFVMDSAEPGRLEEVQATLCK
jgi:ADP-ribosylation factor related protein 1